MGVDDLRSAHPVLTADRGELREGLVEVTRTRSAGEEEVELFAAQGQPLAEQRHTLDGGHRRSPLDGETKQAEKDLLVLGGRRDADAPTLSRSVLELEAKAELRAAEATEGEALGQSGHETA